MDELRAELERAQDLNVADLADEIEAIGFSCTRCGACCKGHGEDHTATIFPQEVRDIAAPGGSAGDESYDWRDVARPMPFGLGLDETGAPAGETFEWALQTDACGNCTFYDDGPADGPGSCTVYADRPMICRTYPFSVELGKMEPMGDVVDRAGPVRAHECEGLGRAMNRDEAESLAAALKNRAVRELEEMLKVREEYAPVDGDEVSLVVHDSEGAKRPDGTPIE